MKSLCLFFLMFSPQLFSQTQSFELKGKSPIEFTLNWTEKEGIARGTYQDNFYGTSNLVKGIVSDLGRIFLVTFPKESHGARSLMIVGPEIKNQKQLQNVSVSLVVRDHTGNPIRTLPQTASLSPLKPTRIQAQEAPPCQEGFGELAGVCGIYSGIMKEEKDDENRCHLMAEKSLRLGITENGSVVILIGPVSEIVESVAHHIGRLPADAESRRVSVLNRQCRPLPGTTFSGDHCKLLDLSGEFTEKKGVKHFKGTYTITNEVNKEQCRYDLSMDKEI